MKRKIHRRRSAICTHHITYTPERTVKVWTGEHMILTRLQWRTRNISKGFIEALKLWIMENEGKAVDLEDRKP